MERYAQVLEKKLTYQEILSYHVSHEKFALEKRCVSGSKIVERVSSYQFWIDKAKDAA
jgi:hypothetical protein